MAPLSGGAALATLTMLRVPGQHRTFALARKGKAGKELAEIPGATGGTVRLLGTGSGPRGLSPMPEVHRWGLLVPRWSSVGAARRFLDASEWMTSYTAKAVERLDLFLVPISGHGWWNKETPFGRVERKDRCPVNHDPRPRVPNGAAAWPGLEQAPLAVLTRASIRATTLPKFWRAAAAVEDDLTRCGALFAMGLGELPWIRQATFSVWSDLAAMRRFAYEEPAHREAMREAQAKGWFVEDMFVRFRVVAARGSWGGVDPFAGADLPGLPG